MTKQSILFGPKQIHFITKAKEKTKAKKKNENENGLIKC